MLRDFAIMNALADSAHDQGKQKWRQFFSLLLIFIAAAIASSLLPTPGSWSDTRSQWLPPTAMALIASGLFVACFWIYCRPGLVFKIQAVMLWLLFGAVLVIALREVYESFTFLRDVRVSGV
jgi:hypothetical protein